MGSAITSYGGGGVTTRTAGPGYQGPAGVGDTSALADFWRQMAMRRQQARMPTIAPSTRPAEEQLGERPMEDPIDRAMRSLKLHEAVEASRPAPMKYTYPWGSAGFLTMDPEAMSGNQRRMFLPGGSSFAPSTMGPGAVSSPPKPTPRDDGSRADWLYGGRG